jgi:hypothetical protein
VEDLKNSMSLAFGSRLGLNGCTVAVALALAPPAGLLAQSAVTGTVAGTVSSQRQPVPGVTVRLTSPALQGERVVTTGSNGDYVALGLPPGEYVIQFSKPGMSTVTRTATVDLSGTTRMDANLDVVAIEALTIRGDLPTPIATAQLGANYKAADLDKLPVARTLAAIAVQTPGVVISGLRDGQIRINGAFGYDNVFLVDGTDVNDNLHGTANNLYIEEAVAETAVLTGGIPAEYGRFTGGVVNAITKSGGNSFSGSVRLDLTNPDWTEKTPYEEERDIPRLDAIDEVYSATLGGPILRDRLWFFAAGRLSETTMAQTLPESGARVNTVTDNPRWEVKLTGNIASKHTLQASYLDNEEKNLDRPSAPGSTADIRGVDRARTVPNTRWAASYHGVWTPRLFFELKYSEKEFGFRGAGGDLTGIRDSPFVTLSLPGRQYNAVYFDASDPEDRDNEDLTASVSYFLSTGRLGSLGFKLGYERFRTTRIGGNSQTATGYAFVTNYVTTTGAPVGPPVLDSQGRFIPIFVNSGPLRTVLQNWLPVRGARIDITTDAFFLQDSWDFNDHLSFNLGIRYEAVKSEATGDIVAADTDRFTPRLAASYDVRGDAKLKFNATYSQYAGKFSETQFGRNSNVGVPNFLTYLYTGPNGQGVDFAPGFDLANYTLINGNFPTRNVFFADVVKSPIVEEWTVGAGSALGRGGFAKLTYVSREYSDLFEDFILREFGTTEIIHEGRSFGFFDNVIQDNTDDLTREYQAIQVQGRYRITDRWLLDANYTHEIENNGNFVGEGLGNPGASSIFGNQPELYDPERHYPTGRLPGYQGHRVRVFSSYTLPIRSFGDVNLGLAYSYDSPQTFSYAFVRGGFTSAQIARDPGYARRPDRQSVFFGERGAGEYEDIHSLDLAISLGVRVWRSVEPFFKFDVRNVTNEQGLVVFDTVVVPCTTAAQAGCDGQAPVDELGLPTKFARGPAFGTARSAADYQIPREYRFSAGIRF